MMNSLGWQTVVATPPIVSQGLSTVCPPVTDVPASSARSYKCNISVYLMTGVRTLYN